MKRKTMQLGRWAAAVLLCSLTLSPSARSQESCPCSWYDAVPPNLDWGLPPTLGEMFPCNFYDTEEALANFLVPLDRLQSALPPGVQALPANAAPWAYLDDTYAGYGLVCVMFFKHNSVQYGEPYNVVFVMAMVDDPAWSEGFSAWYGFGTGVITSEAAQWWGGAAFGWPCAMGDARFEVKPQGIKAFAWADGELVMKMDVGTEDMILVPPAPDPTLLQSTKEGYLTRARMIGTPEIRYVSWTHGTSTLKLGEHPIAQQLRAIGLGEYPSVMQIWSKHMPGTLERGNCTPLPDPNSN